MDEPPVASYRTLIVIIVKFDQTYFSKFLANLQKYKIHSTHLLAVTHAKTVQFEDKYYFGRMWCLDFLL